MQKKILGLFAISLLFGLVACGDETTINEVTAINTVVSIKNLDKCSEGNDGTFIYVSDSSAVYYCADGKWQTLNGKDGSDGKDGLTETDTIVVQKTVVTVDTVVLSTHDTVYHLDTLTKLDTLVISKVDTVVVKDTVVGLNGESCSATDTVNADGLAGININCGSTRAGTIWNGKDGKSAYEIAVENGFTGTEEEWLESLKSQSSSSFEIQSSSSSESPSSSNSEIQSSSSSETLSSSTTSSSSSAKSAWDYLNPAISYGEMTDDRDGQVYKTVVIGTQTWMAQNLNYDYNEGSANSYCYRYNADSCAKYGRLYTWAAAIDSVAMFSENGKDCGYVRTCTVTEPARGVCPEGWHIPSVDDWSSLFTFIGGSSTAGTKLKSISGWYSDGNGEDAYGFSVVPAGDYNSGSFYYVGSQGRFWSSTYFDRENAYYKSFNYDKSLVIESIYSKDFAYSVRCVKDSD